MSGHAHAAANTDKNPVRAPRDDSSQFNYLNFARWPCPGSKQSPIDLHDEPMDQEEIHIISSANRRFRPLKLTYPVNSKHHYLEGDPNTVKLLELHGGFEGVTIGGSGVERFDIKNLHFHAPSEHTVEGRYFDLEMHMVHGTAENKLAVLGVFFEMSEEPSPLLNAVINHMPLDLQSWLGAVKDSFHFYEGSLTTPPCSEGINWFVLHYGKHGALSASAEQIGYFTNLWGARETFAHGHGNNRPLQPINDRTIYKMVPSRRP